MNKSNDDDDDDEERVKESDNDDKSAKDDAPTKPSSPLQAPLPAPPAVANEENGMDVEAPIEGKKEEEKEETEDKKKNKEKKASKKSVAMKKKKKSNDNEKDDDDDDDNDNDDDVKKKVQPKKRKAPKEKDEENGDEDNDTKKPSKKKPKEVKKGKREIEVKKEQEDDDNGDERMSDAEENDDDEAAQKSHGKKSKKEGSKAKKEYKKDNNNDDNNDDEKESKEKDSKKKEKQYKEEESNDNDGDSDSAAKVDSLEKKKTKTKKKKSKDISAKKKPKQQQQQYGEDYDEEDMEALRDKLFVGTVKEISTHKITGPVILLTRCSRGQMRLYQEVNCLGGHITDKIQCATHVVNGDGSRTIKLMKGILKGLWVVTAAWVHESAKASRWLEEEGFEMRKEFPGTAKSREMHAKRQDAKGLFDGIKFFVDKTRGDDDLPPAEVKAIILAGGGDLLSLNDLDSADYYVVGKAKAPSHAVPSKTTVIQSTKLYDSVSQYEKDFLRRSGSGSMQ